MNLHCFLHHSDRIIWIYIVFASFWQNSYEFTLFFGPFTWIYIVFCIILTEINRMSLHCFLHRSDRNHTNLLCVHNSDRIILTEIIWICICFAPFWQKSHEFKLFLHHSDRNHMNWQLFLHHSHRNNMNLHSVLYDSDINHMNLHSC